jgi:predicted nucleic acid-binding protein
MFTYSLIPDSTFYICFLDDIKKPEYLKKIIHNNNFNIFIGQIINNEIKKSNNYKSLEKDMGSKIKLFKYYQYGEILRPLFSKEEIKKGEHEVIVIAFILFSENEKFIAILDDIAPRNFIQKNFPKIYKSIEWTVGFIKNCFYKYKIFSKEETLIILKLIQNSKFRIDSGIISRIISEVRCS